MAVEGADDPLEAPVEVAVDPVTPVDPVVPVVPVDPIEPE